MSGFTVLMPSVRSNERPATGTSESLSASPVVAADSFGHTLRQQIRQQTRGSSDSGQEQRPEATVNADLVSDSAPVRSSATTSSEGSASTSSDSESVASSAEQSVAEALMLDPWLQSMLGQQTVLSTGLSPAATEPAADSVLVTTGSGVGDGGRNIPGRALLPSDGAALDGVAQDQETLDSASLDTRLDIGAITDQHTAMTAGPSALTAQHTQDTSFSARLSALSATATNAGRAPLTSDAFTDMQTPSALAQGLVQSADAPGLGQAAMLGSTDNSQTEAIADRATDSINLWTSVPASAISAPAQPVTDNMPWVTTALNVPFAQQERWQSAIQQHVLSMASAGDEVASLTLSPPDLGPVHIVLTVDNQSVDASFISEHADVRQALEDGLQHLRERMHAQGLQLGHSFVGNGHQAQQHFNQQSAQPASGDQAQTVAASEQAQPITPVRRQLAPGAIDTFA